ncbi:hypothetical protein RGQ29_026389 [Quercus rubra]|uniref:Uncharacterized protein n=1 Tax=Quercus rubra TaxID=3512 RepID=A0AAN7F0K0_QUERU|nr:hypothetical protein RGQ29_026389 [Quercus rubra]
MNYLKVGLYYCNVIDLDDTLYPLSSGLATSCRKNIEGKSICKIFDLGNLLVYNNYGTTMAGLRNLKPDPVMRSLLLSLPYRKVIFTNADKVHAVKVLNKLGLEDCFEGIICFETLNPIHKSTVSDDEDDIEFPNPSLALPKTPIVCKPSVDAIERALKIANINPQRTLFFEDSVRNIQAGKCLGLHTVGTSQRVKGADYALESIHNIREAIPELLEADIKSEVAYSGKVAVETSVTA